MQKYQGSQRGYTLIELLLYVTIVGTLLTLMAYFFGMSATARIKSETISEVNDQGIAVMEYITQTIRNATSVSAPTAGNSASSLTLVVPTGSASPTVFNLNAATLRVTEGTGSAVALTNSRVQVTNLTFTNLTASGTPGNVRVNFTLSYLNPSNRSEYSYQQTFTNSAEVAW